MSHRIEQTVRAIRRRARWYQVLAGVGWFALAALATVLVLAALDVALRPNDRGLRVLASLAVLASVAFAAWRWLAPTLRVRLSDVDVALMIERRLPELRDRLTSALEFLRAPAAEANLGSATLRRSLIIEVDSQLEGLTPNSALNPRPMVVALASAAAVLLVGAIAWVAAPEAARLSLTHLAAPWAAHDWPRKHELVLVDLPERMARGDDLEITVQDANGNLPRQVELWIIRDDDPQQKPERRGMRPAGEQMAYRLTNVTGSFRVRATGGDHENMPWRQVEVIEPPELGEMAVTLHPPAYAALPARRSPLRIHALAGTRVALAGTASKPLASAAIHVEAGGETKSYPLELDEAGERFQLTTQATVPWVIENSGAYWLELVDRQGIASGSERRWEIEAQPDLPPTLTIESPAAAALATRQAVLPVVLSAWDNLAIQHITLHVRRAETAGEDAAEFAPIILYQGPATPTPPRGAQGQSEADYASETLRIDYDWDLAGLPELKVGDTLLLEFTAGDYVPQASTPITQRLQIVSAEDLLERLSQQQAYIVSRLDEVLTAQLEAQRQVGEMRRQQAEQGEAVAGELARGAELSQRRVRQLLTDRPGGILLEIEQMRAALANNQVDNPDLARTLDRLAEQLGGLVEAHLAPAEETLAAAGLAEAQPQSEPLLAATAEHQTAAVAVLEALLDEHSRFSRYRRLVREVFELRRQQQEIHEATGVLYAEALGGGEMPAEVREAQREALARRQEDLARRAEELLTRMRRAGENLAQAGLAAAAVLEDAVAAAERLQITPCMRRAAQQLDQSQLGQAGQSQQQVLAGLEELLDILANRTERDLGRSAAGLARAGEQLQSALERQRAIRELLEKAEEATGQERQDLLDEAARQERELAGEVERLAREMGRLPAEGAAQSAADAAEAMREAADEAEAENDQNAQDQAELAEGRLQRAQEQVEQALAETRQKLLNEKLARLEQTVRAFLERQEQIKQETFEFEQLVQQQGTLRRPERIRLNDLAKRQFNLSSEVTLLAEEIAATPIFAIALQQAATFMNGASTQMGRGETGLDVTLDQDAAVAHLERLLAALAAAQQNDQQENDNGGGGQGGGGEQPEEDDRQPVPYLLEQLRLLRGIQEEILLATRQLQEESLRVDLTPRQRERIQQRLLELAEMQRQLSRLLAPLVPPEEGEDPRDDDLPPDQSLTQAGRAVPLRVAAGRAELIG